MIENFTSNCLRIFKTHYRRCCIMYRQCVSNIFAIQYSGQIDHINTLIMVKDSHIAWCLANFLVTITIMLCLKAIKSFNNTEIRSGISCFCLQHSKMLHSTPIHFAGKLRTNTQTLKTKKPELYSRKQFSSFELEKGMAPRLIGT